MSALYVLPLTILVQPVILRRRNPVVLYAFAVTLLMWVGSMIWFGLMILPGINCLVLSLNVHNVFYSLLGVGAYYW